MIKLDRHPTPITVDEEETYLENVVATIIAEEFMGYDTIIGWVYINDEGKLRRHWEWWFRDNDE